MEKIEKVGYTVVMPYVDIKIGYVLVGYKIEPDTDSAGKIDFVNVLIGYRN